jgi:hypothetical protein
MPNTQIGKPREKGLAMKRMIRLPRSNEGGMLLDMPHAAYLARVLRLEDQ